MYCPHCGKEIEDNSRYCGNCGYQLVKKKHISMDLQSFITLKECFQEPLKSQDLSLPLSVLVMILVFLVNLFLSYRILPAFMHVAGRIIGTKNLAGYLSGYFRASGSTHLVNAVVCTIALYAVLMLAVAFCTYLKKEKLSFQSLFEKSSGILWIPLILVFCGTLFVSVPWLSACFDLMALILILLNIFNQMPGSLNGWWKSLILMVSTVLILKAYSRAASLVIQEAAGTSFRYFMKGGF